MSEKAPVVILGRPDAGVAWITMRIDADRDTEITVQRNVNKHVYVQIGKSGRSGEITLIMHPHAAARLIANIEAVLGGNYIGDKACLRT